MSRPEVPRPFGIVDLLRAKIASGEYPEGSKLPGETALAEQLQASRSTVRRAVVELGREGLVSAARGRGTFVRMRPERRTILIGDHARHEDLLDPAYAPTRRGWTPLWSTRGPSSQAQRAHPRGRESRIVGCGVEKAQALGVSPKQPVILREQRWRHQENGYVIGLSSFAPTSLFESLTDRPEFGDDGRWTSEEGGTPASAGVGPASDRVGLGSTGGGMDADGRGPASGGSGQTAACGGLVPGGTGQAAGGGGRASASAGLDPDGRGPASGGAGLAARGGRLPSAAAGAGADGLRQTPAGGRLRLPSDGGGPQSDRGIAVYPELMRRHGLVTFTTSVRARMPTVQERAELEIEVGVPIMIVTRTMLDPSGRALEATVVHAPADRFEVAHASRKPILSL